VLGCSCQSRWPLAREPDFIWIFYCAAHLRRKLLAHPTRAGSQMKAALEGTTLLRLPGAVALGSPPTSAIQTSTTLGTASALQPQSCHLAQTRADARCAHTPIEATLLRVRQIHSLGSGHAQALVPLPERPMPFHEAVLTCSQVLGPRFLEQTAE